MNIEQATLLARFFTEDNTEEIIFSLNKMIEEHMFKSIFNSSLDHYILPDYHILENLNE